jgi:Ran GTPase-activating protein (RanGAP) involved in mRNA processing and transport
MFANSMQWQQLATLDLLYNEIRDSGVVALVAALGEGRAVEVLDLSYNKIGKVCACSVTEHHCGSDGRVG